MSNFYTVQELADIFTDLASIGHGSSKFIMYIPAGEYNETTAVGLINPDTEDEEDAHWLLEQDSDGAYTLFAYPTIAQDYCD